VGSSGRRHKPLQQQVRAPSLPKHGPSRPAQVGDDARAELWERLRQGSRNVAGVTWQLAVSVHVLVMSRVGDLPFTTVVPEGLEDLDCRTAAGYETLVQVKEVGAGVGRLTASTVGEVVEHAMRATAGPIVLVTDGELGSGLRFTGWNDALAAQLGQARGAVIDDLMRRGISPVDAATALERVHLVSLPWNVREETEALISQRLDVHPTVASFTIGSLYESLGAAAAEQRRRDASGARMLRVANVDLALAAVQSAVDVNGLDSAVAAGVCRPGDYSAIGGTSASQFYLGVSGAPVHIAQALDVIRAPEMEQLTQAAQIERYALIAGPSGSGKSVLLWRAARDVILGARVVRVARVATEEDMRLLVRHVEMLRPTTTSPVVVAADNLGRPHMAAWPDAVDRLREMCVFVLGACREEDFGPRLVRGSARVVKPVLDLATSELIAERVERAGLTVKMTAAEAFGRSDGLLMEFLSLLREGMRMGQVLALQAAELAAPGREVQREAARLVLAAHAVGLSLSARMLGDALAGIAGSTIAVGDALAVLKDEHIVLDDGDVWTGLHELRSHTLTGLMHASPPPSLGDTLRTVARLVPADEAGWLLRRTAERFPDTVIAVAHAVADHTRKPGVSAAQVAELLEGAERADNAAYAAACLPIIRSSLPRGIAPVPIASYIYGIRHQGASLGPIGVPAFDRMAVEFNSVAKRLPNRSALALHAAASQLDPARVVDLAISGTLTDAVRLLEALAGTVALGLRDAAEIFQAHDAPHEPVGAEAWSRLIEALAAFVEAEDRSSVFGTVEHRAMVIAQAEPSAVALDIEAGMNPSLTIMRGTDDPDRLGQMAWDNPSPASRDALNDFVVALAGQFVSACPEASLVEVITITPSGRRYTVANHEPGYKRMARDAFPDRVGVRRNVGFQGAVHRLSAAATWSALVTEQSKIGHELAALAEDAPFRLRANDQENARRDWAGRLQTAIQLAAELASKPADRSTIRSTSHAWEDQSQREVDLTSEALSATAQALDNLLKNENHVAAAMTSRDAVAKLADARAVSSPTITGLGTPIPDTLGPALERLARAAVAAARNPAPWRSVRFGDHEAVESIVASAASDATDAQRALLTPLLARVPRANLQPVSDPAPFPGSIDGTAWLMTVPLDYWDAAVQALDALDTTARQALDCNVVIVAMDGTVLLPLGVRMSHYGPQSALPLSRESLEQHLAAAGLALPHAVSSGTQGISDVVARTVRASWSTALNHRRPADWPSTVPAPTGDDFTSVSMAAAAVAAELPGRVGKTVEAAISVLVMQVKQELKGNATVTLSGELLDFLDQGPSAAAVDAGLWDALAALSLAPLDRGAFAEASEG
jgi:hypothetical protein